MECGFYVATWLERQILKIAGKPTLEVTCKVNVKQMKGAPAEAAVLLDAHHEASAGRCAKE